MNFLRNCFSRCGAISARDILLLGLLWIPMSILAAVVSGQWEAWGWSAAVLVASFSVFAFLRLDKERRGH